MKVAVGTAIAIVNSSGQVLMHKRKGSHGSSEWALPGGSVDPDEFACAAAIREVYEETGLIVTDLKRVGINLHFFEEIQKEYVTIYYRCYNREGIPRVMEPEKVDGEWEWITPGNWPSPIFEDTISMIEGKL